MMFGFRMGPLMKIGWLGATPIYTLVIFVMGCISYSDLTYKRKTVTYEYPGWAIGVGWVLASMSVIFIPIVMVFRILRTPGTLSERVKYLTKPRLRRHQIRSTENLSNIILEEDSFFKDLEEKIDGGVGDSLLTVDQQHFPLKSAAATDILLNGNEKKQPLV